MTFNFKNIQQEVVSKLSFRLFAGVLILLFAACANRNAGGVNGPQDEGDTLTVNARLLKLVRHDGGIITAEVTNPWDTTHVMSLYALIPRELVLEVRDIYEGYTVIPTPVRSMLVYSGVHAQPLADLGASKMITGVADGQYFTVPEVVKGLQTGNIIDVGSAMSPSLEKIVDLSPEVALTSPYQNTGGHGVLDKAGITVVDMADYMEATPLGRAEWMLLLGALAGDVDKAIAEFNSRAEAYRAARGSISATTSRPTVIMEVPYSGVWYQPGGESYLTHLIEDAGAYTLTRGDGVSGSVQMDIANVYESGQNADYWLIKSDRTLTLADIAASTPLAKKFNAFINGKVAVCNTTETGYYEITPFNPELLLTDLIGIFHPEDAPKLNRRFYLPVNR